MIVNEITLTVLFSIAERLMNERTGLLDSIRQK